MGIINDLRKEVEKGKRKIAAAERIMELWKKKAREQKARADMEELIMTAMVLKNGGDIKVETEDIKTAAEHHLDGRVEDTEDGRVYFYHARSDSGERRAAGEN